MADVSGKGVSAAVVASILQGMLYSQLARDSPAAGDDRGGEPLPVRKSRRPKIRDAGDRATSESGELELINCGHVPPLLVSGDTIIKLEEGNLPVGLVPGADFTRDACS